MTDGGFLLEAKSSLSHEELFLLLCFIINNLCYGEVLCWSSLFHEHMHIQVPFCFLINAFLPESESSVKCFD